LFLDQLAEFLHVVARARRVDPVIGRRRETLTEQHEQPLIGWAVSNPNFPGGMPFPDRHGDGNYDGQSDCPPAINEQAVGGTPALALGRLPWLGQTAPCESFPTMGGLAGNPRDGAGESLWYAVSGNLLRFNLGTYFGGVAAETDPAVNWFDPFVSPPDTTDAPDVDDPPFDWLTVCDASGAVLSSRVAFVVIAPGAPVYRGDLGTGRLQSRAGAAPNPNEYLDRIVIAGATCDTDNANADGQFVMAADAELASTAGAAVDGFNDRLVPSFKPHALA